MNGLVLAGGRSTRMGAPKETIHWHGNEQQYVAAHLLTHFCNGVFISCRPDQLEHIASGYQGLPDTFPEMGPLGGILSAMHFRKDSAWLVIACDMPLLDKEALDFLVRSRDPEKSATAYESPLDGGPEPLAAIWEPKSYPLLMDFIKSGSHSPRKFLMNNDILMLKSKNPQVLRNVNTPEDAAEIESMMKRRKKGDFL